MGRCGLGSAVQRKGDPERSPLDYSRPDVAIFWASSVDP